MSAEKRNMGWKPMLRGTGILPVLADESATGRRVGRAVPASEAGHSPAYGYSYIREPES